MRKKARPKNASPRGAQGSANGDLKARENAPLREIKHIWRPTKPPTGKGLGKAGAKRLGRLLKRAIRHPEEPSARLPKTPVRLFKHQVQTEAQNAPKTNAAKPASCHVSQLILSVVSQCKHRGGISMAELKQTLASGGYDVTRNNRRVNVATKRLVNNETLIRTTRNVSYRLNKKQTDTVQVKTSSVKSPKAKGLKQSKTSNKPTKGAEKSRQSQARKIPKSKVKTAKPKGKTRKAAAESHKPRRKTPKARRKSPKPAGKKSRSATNRTARARKAPRKARRARRRRPNRHPYKSSRKRQSRRRRLPKTKSRLKTRRRRSYYY